ncbi:MULTISPECIES: hypothetical protein [unclassified Mesorhizobium]|uniref:hypothetical protein n=1 Tax=unclassified Mesorhizobium TaxID=325217 RepID=UPI000BAEBB72|nr:MULTISPECIES: hypothetical protein [unclassified Mesorhizobium]PBB26127.1 hypothetical protein CK232_13350 [Mesorhizobium sp. WSM4304]PBB75786.1 hypothetical protein CK227_09305 [Mesorhizobium sp. WSM4308]
MIPTDFLRYEDVLAPADFQKIGQLTLRWSLIEHTIGNCLRVLLRLTPAESVPMVFKLAARERRERIRELIAVNPVPPETEFLFKELDVVMQAIQPVRNNLVHSILLWTGDRKNLFFHLRSKDKNLTKEEVFATEDLTTYALLAVLNFRFAVGPKDHDPDEIPPPLPERPEVPEFLRPSLRWPEKPSTAVSGL